MLNLARLNILREVVQRASFSSAAEALDYTQSAVSQAVARLEAETGASLVVRDRGKGFDPAAVPADRKGLAESVHGRMTRRGGTVTVTSSPGEGTKVSLKMPRAAAQPHPVSRAR